MCKLLSQQAQEEAPGTGSGSGCSLQPAFGGSHSAVPGKTHGTVSKLCEHKKPEEVVRKGTQGGGKARCSLGPHGDQQRCQIWYQADKPSRPVQHHGVPINGVAKSWAGLSD